VLVEELLFEDVGVAVGQDEEKSRVRFGQLDGYREQAFCADAFDRRQFTGIMRPGTAGVVERSYDVGAGQLAPVPEVNPSPQSEHVGSQVWLADALRQPVLEPAVGADHLQLLERQTVGDRVERPARHGRVERAEGLGHADPEKGDHSSRAEIRFGGLR
jgi:hypothetical protein